MAGQPETQARAAGADGNETAQTPPRALVRHWTRSGILPDDSAWLTLPGGRTNSVWQVTSGPGAWVCKLYGRARHTPLFANDPGAERLALSALAGSGLAPRMVAAAQTPAGQSLIYAHVPGRRWRAGDEPGPVARALVRLHRAVPPEGLPAAPMGARALVAQTRDMIAQLGAPGRAVAELAPEVPDLPAVRPVFLHGDATAGNALVTPAGITFIDWQCPSRGDATEDIAVFLSPGMQAISGNEPLPQAAIEAFLAAYGEAETVARYRSLAPLYHWRMAAYCLWRAARGDHGYSAAAKLELTMLRSAPRAR